MTSNKTFRLKVFLILSCLLIVFSPFSKCFAIEETDDYIDRFAAYGNRFYDPFACGDGGSGGLSGKNTKEKMWNYFRGKGLNEAQTAGILGNAYVESGFTTTRRSSSNSGYFGLFQWDVSNPDTKKMLDKFDSEGLKEYYDDYAKYGGSGGDKDIAGGTINKILQIELDFAWDTWRSSYNWKEKIQGKVGDEKEPEFAAEVFVVEFEGAIETPSYKGDPLLYYTPTEPKWQGKNYQGASNRRSQARKIYDEFKGSSVKEGDSSNNKVTASGNCCDEGASSDGIYQGTTYNLTDGQVRGITAMAAAENGSSVAGIKSEASLMANLFEYKKPNDKGKADELVNYLKTGGWFSTAKRYDENYSANEEYVKAVKNVLVNGNRTLPLQIVEHDCFTSECGAGISSATNYGAEINLKDKSQFKRGITKLHQGGGNLNGTYIFWDWADPQKKTGDPFGYFENNPPQQGVLNATKGTNSKEVAGSSVTWSGGWIANGLNGYFKNEATKSSLSGLPSSFGADYSTTSPKGSGTGPDKVTLHVTNSTDGGGSSGLKLYEGNPYPPHFTVDIKNHKTYQHGAIIRTASAMGASGSNSSAGVQVSIVGFAKKTNGSSGWDLSGSDFSDADWKYLGEVLVAISTETDIDLSKKLVGSGIDEIVKKAKAGVEAFKAGQNKKCEAGFGGEYGKLWDLLVKIAYPKFYKAGAADNPKDPMPYYGELIKKTNYSHGGDGTAKTSGQDCSGFVGLFLKESGWDKNYPGCCCKIQYGYLTGSNNGKWKEITTEVKKDNSNLLPGDVLMAANHGHTLIYVGDVPDSKWDKKAKYASASYCERWPMAQKSDAYYLIHTGDDHHGKTRLYRVFRRAK